MALGFMPSNNLKHNFKACMFRDLVVDCQIPPQSGQVKSLESCPPAGSEQGVQEDCALQSTHGLRGQVDEQAPSAQKPACPHRAPLPRGAPSHPGDLAQSVFSSSEPACCTLRCAKLILTEPGGVAGRGA